MANRRSRAEVDFVTKYSGRHNMRRLSGDIGSTTRLMRRMATGALALGGIAGLGYVTKQTMGTIDATAKLSDRLGIATEKLIGLQHAAKISGVDNINKPLEIFTKRLGEVQMGTGEAERALDALGLTVDELVNKTPDEAIGVVADQISRLKTQSEKAAAANFLFGRSGQQLLNMFEMGSAGIDEYQAKVEALGMTYSRVDAAKVEAANDAIANMRGALQGLVNKGIIQASPYIEALADLMTEAATGGGDFGKAVVDGSEQAVLALSKVGRAMDNIVTKVPKMKSDATLALLIAKRAVIEKQSEYQLGRAKRAVRLPLVKDALAEHKRLKQQLVQIDKEIGRETDLFPQIDEASEIGKIERIFEKIREKANTAAAAAADPKNRPALVPMVDDGSVEVGEGERALRESAEALTDSLARQIEIYERVNDKRATNVEMAAFQM